MQNQPSSIIYPRGIAQVEADRKRLGITPEILDRKRLHSLSQPF
jgi:hypothetical protein